MEGRARAGGRIHCQQAAVRVPDGVGQALTRRPVVSETPTAPPQAITRGPTRPPGVSKRLTRPASLLLLSFTVAPTAATSPPGYNAWLGACR